MNNILINPVNGYKIFLFFYPIAASDLGDGHAQDNPKHYNPGFVIRVIH